MPAADAATAPPLTAAAPLPPLARRLVYGGLVPFVAGALLVWLVREEAIADVGLALTAYTALIASFLGGIHWGLALRHAEPPAALLLWGVVPALVAWPAVLMPAHAGLVILGTLLVGCYLVDRRVYPAHGAGTWLTLRFRASAVAALCCFIGAAGS